METDVDYEQVGRFIYGFVRVRGNFGFFCQALAPAADPIPPDMPVSHFVGRAQEVLAQRYGADSAIAREFSETATIMFAGDVRMNDIKAGFDATKVPGDGETNRVLGVQARLDHIRQLIATA